MNADLDEELEVSTQATEIGKTAQSRALAAKRTKEEALSSTQSSMKAQRRAINAAANAHAAKLSAAEAANIMKEAGEKTSDAREGAAQALGEMAKAKSTLLRGVLKNAVSRVVQKASIEKKVADCTQRCTAILDAIEGAEPYTLNVLRAVSLGFD